MSGLVMNGRNAERGRITRSRPRSRKSPSPATSIRCSRPAGRRRRPHLARGAGRLRV